MTSVFRIVIADRDADARSLLRQNLQRLHHEVVAEVGSGVELTAAAHQHMPDLVVTDTCLEGLDGLAAVELISTQREVPIIFTSACSNTEFVDAAIERRAWAYLIKPISEFDLGPAISVAMRRFTEAEALKREAEDARQALRDRKIIERAKGLIMDRQGLPEAEAFRHLQSAARHNRRKLVDIAERILKTESLIGGRC